MKLTDCKRYLLCRRRRRRLSCEARRAIREFHRGHEARHRETTQEYVANAAAFVIGRLGDRGQPVELTAFREGEPATWHSVKDMQVLSHRTFKDNGIAFRCDDATGFVTTYYSSHKWGIADDDCECGCSRPDATSKVKRPWLLIRRDRFDALAAECAGYRRTGTLLSWEAEDIAKVAVKLIDEINNEFRGDADDGSIDIVTTAGWK